MLLLFGLAGGAWATSPRESVLQARHVWARATAPGAELGVVYFELHNSGATDTLLSIETPVAARAQIHSERFDHGMMQMRVLDAIAVPRGHTLVFAPGRQHLMLMELRRPLQEGDRFPLTLVFKHGGRLALTVEVRGLAAGTGRESPGTGGERQ